MQDLIDAAIREAEILSKSLSKEDYVEFCQELSSCFSDSANAAEQELIQEQDNAE